MSNILLCAVFVPIVAAAAVILARRRASGASVVASIISVAIAVAIYLQSSANFSFMLFRAGGLEIDLTFRSYAFNSYVLMAAAVIALLISVYSLSFAEKMKDLPNYYGNILLALGASSGAILANDLITFTVFWGLSGVALYNLINCGGVKAGNAAKKTFVIIGGADALMILGVAIIWLLTRSFDMSSIRIAVNGFLPTIAFICLALASFAKCGAIPFNSWIPGCAEVAPLPVMAYLPASLDKLLGIYFLARLSLELFSVTPNSPVSIMLLALGSLTIMTAVLAALVQHDLRKLLSFHTVSQVGYMIIGIGTGLPVGIAGGLLHMLNNVIYKTCLFLGTGAVQKEAGGTDLDDLGGLARYMPVTFLSMLTAALAISGIPPLNGFFSKWMIYQSVIMLGSSGNPLWIVWLTCAMFGSALTLASFLKVINAVFLRDARRVGRRMGEVPPTMWIPMAFLASLCLLFGIFAFQLPIKYFIAPAVPFTFFAVNWAPRSASALLIAGLTIGAVIYLLGKHKAARVTPPFISGESIAQEKLSQSGVSFYNTIKEVDILKDIYSRAEGGGWDLYEGSKVAVMWVSDRLRSLQSGLLHTYMAWCLLGLVILLFVFFRG